MYASANRDATVWPDPYEFRIDCDARSHLAFGWGLHYCIGAPLARLEIRVAHPTPPNPRTGWVAYASQGTPPTQNPSNPNSVGGVRLRGNATHREPDREFEGGPERDGVTASVPTCSRVTRAGR